MAFFHKLIEFFMSRPAEWRAHGSNMRRWNGSCWETRPMTANEVEEASWWQGIR